MRRRPEALLFSVLCAQLLAAQSFRWEAAVPLVEKAGSYRIVLTPEFVGCSRMELGDVRLVDSTGEEVPYVLDVAMRYKTKGEFHDFVITRNEVVGKRTLLELERPDAGILVDHISLRLRNAEVAKTVEITGSDDGANWYVIKNDRLQLVRGIQLANITQEIVLPPTDYRHYRIALNDSLSPPIRVLGAQWFSQARSYGEYSAAQGVRWTQQDSANTTRIHIPRAFPHPIDRIQFAVSDTQAFRRACDMTTWRTNTSGRGRKKHTWHGTETIASFVVSSEDGPTVDLPGVRATSFDLLFDNGDDRPLHFTDVRFLQLERTITANLRPGMYYALTTGDPMKNAPRYDMEHFRDELPEPLAKLVPGMVELRPAPPSTPPLFDPSRWWVWAVIVVLILGIGTMALRMLRAAPPNGTDLMRIPLFAPYALLSAIAILCTHMAQAQCPGCSPDFACMVSPAYPTLCPTTPPDATAGEPYVADFTFWMPTSFADPGSGFTVDFQQMTITGISGLPFGLAFEASAPGGVYYPQENQFGCARVCGTPIGAGVYTVTISILATVTYSGITINSPQQFPIVLTVLAGSGGNLSFSYSPTSGCSPVTATFQALIDAAPSPMTYAWDFGNGNTSNAAQPPVQTYEEPGTYVISLQTTVGGFVLNSVTLTGVNDNWCGDVEEPDIPFVGCTGTPDPYFVLTNAGGGTVTSGTVDNSSTASWTDLGVLLDNSPYSISFYDEDAVSQNDLLGTYNIPANGAGTYFINVAGGTTGSLDISIEPVQLFADTDTIVVFPLPELLLLQDTVTGELCTLNDSLVNYVWFLDGDTVPMASGPCLTPNGPGLWQVSGTNGFGCSMMSDAIVICPEFDIVRNDDVLFVPSGYSTYSWTHDGVLIGGNDAFIFTEGDGIYAVTVDAGNGCILHEEYVLITTEVAVGPSDDVRFSAFPVPNHGEFTVVAEGLVSGTVQLQLIDLTGRVLARRTETTNGGTLRVQMTVSVAPGSYLLRLVDGERIHVSRLAVH